MGQEPQGRVRTNPLSRLPGWTGTLAAVVAAAAGLACITVPEFRRLESEVAELRGSRGGAPQDVRLAELGASIQELEREVASLRGAVEEVRHAAEEARRTAEETQEALRLGRQQGGGAEEAPSAVSAPSQEVRDYEEGFTLYAGGNYRGAIDRFRSFLQNHPSSEYADNALFWIGECQFRLGDYERAVLTFEDVVKRHPEGNKVPDALYRQGVALLEIGKRNGEEAIYRSAAREIFERIVKEYPGSDRETEARAQLEKLRL